jgi:hypothetical protein
MYCADKECPVYETKKIHNKHKIPAIYYILSDLDSQCDREFHYYLF